MTTTWKGIPTTGSPGVNNVSGTPVKSAALLTNMIPEDNEYRVLIFTAAFTGTTYIIEVAAVKGGYIAQDVITNAAAEQTFDHLIPGIRLVTNANVVAGDVATVTTGYGLSNLTGTPLAYGGYGIASEKKIVLWHGALTGTGTTGTPPGTLRWMPFNTVGYATVMFTANITASTSTTSTSQLNLAAMVDPTDTTTILSIHNSIALPAALNSTGKKLTRRYVIISPVQALVLNVTSATTGTITGTYYAHLSTIETNSAYP
jgi:hypothetical protein